LEIGQLDLGAAYDVYVSGSTAFVSNNDGIAILDIRDVHDPQQVITIDENSGGGTVAGLFVSGDSLLGFGEQFTIYDVADPANPHTLASYLPRSFISAARMQGEFAYLSYLHGGLDVIDFSDPANPTSVGYAEFPGQVNDLAINGSFAYVANSHAGLEVYDVSEATSPQRVGIVAGTAGAWDIYIDQDLLFLGCHMYGVRILDISDPLTAEVVGSFDNGGETYGVHALGERLFSVDLQQGVEVLDVSTPSQPRLTAGDDSYHPHDLYSDGQYLYLADQDRHFVVLPLELGERI